MRPEALEKMLRLGEDTLTEFKSVALSNYKPDVNDLAKSLCALANAKGGYLLLGVEDDGTVTGLGTPAEADAVMRKVSEACSKNLQPALLCTIEKIEAKGGLVLAVQVPAFNPDRPYNTKGEYWVRDGATSREARREELIRLLLQSVDFHYDEEPVKGTTLEDLERDAVQDFVEKAYEGVDPEYGWTQWLHTRPASQIRVFIYKDRVEVINPGELLNRLTLEGIRSGGLSQRRNPIICSLLARADRRENMGLGLPDVIVMMKRKGFPEPEISVSDGHFKVVVRLEKARAGLGERGEASHF